MVGKAGEWQRLSLAHSSLQYSTWPAVPKELPNCTHSYRKHISNPFGKRHTISYTAHLGGGPRAADGATHLIALYPALPHGRPGVALPLGPGPRPRLARLGQRCGRRARRRGRRNAHGRLLRQDLPDEVTAGGAHVPPRLAPAAEEQERGHLTGVEVRVGVRGEVRREGKPLSRQARRPSME